jgi:hypothetical protein
MRLSVKDIERKNELLAKCKPASMTAGDCGLNIKTWGGRPLSHQSLGLLWETKGRAVKEGVAKAALSIYLTTSEVDEVLAGLDLNWQDNSLVEDIRHIVGKKFEYDPRGSYYTAKDGSLRREH